MTIKLIAWATTSSTTPGAEPGIGVQYTTVEDGLTVDYGDVEVSEGQPLEWGVTEHGDFDGEAADELLERMGFRRVEAWVESGGPYAAEVERIAEEPSEGDITAKIVRFNEGPFLMDTIAGVSGEGEEAEGAFVDTIEIRRNGVLIETIRVEASEDPEPYDDAVAKFGPVRWL